MSQLESVDLGQSNRGAVKFGDDDRTIEGDHGRWVHRVKLVIERAQLLPVGVADVTGIRCAPR